MLTRWATTEKTGGLKVQGRFLLTFHVTSEEIRYKINDYRSFYVFLRLSWEISF